MRPSLQMSSCSGRQASEMQLSTPMRHGVARQLGLPRLQPAGRRVPAAPLQQNLSSPPRFVSTCRVAEVEAPAKAEEAKQPEEAQQQAGGVFSWTKAWYAAAATENLDPTQPNKFTLLGQDYVLWCNGKGEWRCFEDRCPHRLATLSDGIVHRDQDRLVCAYHGYEFEASGKCVRIPHALSEAAEATACASSRSCVTSYPTTTKGGLLWVWPDASPARWVEAAAAEVPLPPELEGDKIVPEKGRWFARDLPYGWDFLMENLLDPGHVEFAHHGVAGLNANDFIKFDLVKVEDRGPAGFRFQNLPSDKSRRGAYVNFYPPNSVVISPGPAPEEKRVPKAEGEARPFSDDPNVLNSLIFYGYPSKPGWCRFHGVSYVTNEKGEPLKKLSLFTNAIPAWLKHILSFAFLNGDDFFLGAATKAYAAEGSNYKKSYWLPTPADNAIVAFRKWLDQYSGNAVPFPPHLIGAEHVIANLNLTREQAMDRYSQHVKYCNSCKGALANTNKTIAVSAVVATAAFLAAGLVTALRAQVAAGAAAVPGWVEGLLGGGALGTAAPLAVVGVLALLVHVAARKLRQGFYYWEWKRPAF